MMTESEYHEKLGHYMNSLTYEQHKEIVEMRKNGMSKRGISVDTGISLTGIRGHLKLEDIE